MAKLNQIIAVEKGAKARAEKAATEVYQAVQKPQLFTGLSRVYAPKDEEGDVLPPEHTRAQMTAELAMTQFQEAVADLFDVTAVKDWSNCSAKANLVVDGKTLLKDVPATYLLFLEKQVERFRAFVRALPVLDPSQTWEYDSNAGVYRAEPKQTVRTAKIPRVLTLAEPTKEHPAQVQVFTEDVAVGTWTTTNFSGAVPADRRTELEARVESLERAVKQAREQANMNEAEEVKAAKPVLDYLFG